MVRSCRLKLLTTLSHNGVLPASPELLSRVPANPSATENAFHAVSIAWTIIDHGIRPLFDNTPLAGLSPRLEASQMVRTRNARGTVMLCHDVYNEICIEAERMTLDEHSGVESDVLTLVLGALDDATYALMLALDASRNSGDGGDSEVFARVSAQRSADFLCKLNSKDFAAAQTLLDLLVSSFDRKHPVLLKVV